MHKLYDFACKQLKELEDKVEKGLSSAEIEYAAKLTELKKNILKIEMLETEGYSADEMPRYYPGYYDHGRSYGRPMYPRNYRYSGGMGYSGGTDDLIAQLETMMDTAPSEMARREISKLIYKMQNV